MNRARRFKGRHDETALQNGFAPSVLLKQTARIAVAGRRGLALLLILPSLLLSAAVTPSIVIILADDLDYGDVRCCNDQSQVATPNIDRLAREGMRFTDAPSPATVCTPSRYRLMTGRMAFRVPNGGRVFEGVGGPSLIKPGRLTLPAMLRTNGYATPAVGKWHVGLTFFDKDGQPVRGLGSRQCGVWISRGVSKAARRSDPWL